MEEEEGVWRDSLAHADEGSDRGRDKEKKKKKEEKEREASGPPYYFVLTDNQTAVTAADTGGAGGAGAMAWYFRCDEAAVADLWIEKLQPFLRKTDKELE